MTIAVEPGVDVIVNGRNRVFIDGYVTDLKYNPETKDMYFRLGAVSMSKKKIGKVYTTYINVYLYSYKAAETARWIHNGMYVEVEAKLRGWMCGDSGREHAEYCLIGINVLPAKQVTARVPISQSIIDKEHNNG